MRGRWPRPTLSDVEELIRSTGFFRAKTRNLLGMAEGLVERFDGQVPSAMADLVTLPGVGRKTANVVRSVAFGLPGLPVDTHVQRLSGRLGLTEETDPVKVEMALNTMVPAARRGAFSLRLILHGRAVCTARSPHCDRCLLVGFLPLRTLGQPDAEGGEHRPDREEIAVELRRPFEGKVTARAGTLPAIRRSFRHTGKNSVVLDWNSVKKRDGLETSEPVPANWFRRAVFGIRRPTRSREGTLRGAFAASAPRSGSVRASGRRWITAVCGSTSTPIW